MMQSADLYIKYQDLQRFVGWTDKDRQRISFVGELLAPYVAGLVEDFYAEIERHPNAAKVITGGSAQIDRLKGTLVVWLRDLLAGPYDVAYVDRRWRVGRRHVEIGLDQVYTNAALSRLRCGLIRVLHQVWPGELNESFLTIESLNKLLDMDLAIIEDAYQTEYVDRHQQDELRVMTQQLWQAARLAGVGELAASIAHELNNPLGTISLRLEGILAKTAEDDLRRRPLEIVEQEVSRMADLVANLLQFSRAGVEMVSTVDVLDEVRKALELVDHHLAKRQITIEPEFHPDTPLIHADRQQLRQVFLNLLTNAADAMPQGGRLFPRIRPGRLSDECPAVVIEIADTGVGIPPELLPRVTEPFFTTKPEGKGTGLGLAICRRIVQQHRGAIDVESRLGHGTTIRITLPLRSHTNTARLHADDSP